MDKFCGVFIFLHLYLQNVETGTDNNTTQGIISATEVTVANDYEDKFDDAELKRLFVRNFIMYRRIHQERLKMESEKSVKSRQSRNVARKLKVMECFACFANSSSNDELKTNENCYKGVSIPTTVCTNIEYCFTELHPLFIRRGCAIPGTGNLNRTFVCKCPLCNDKPSYEVIHYNYMNIGDWEYDNNRLQRDAISLMCKICETNGTNDNADNNCRQGKNTAYVVCAKNQLCYTQMDEDSYVSRGCIDKPFYNSLYNICNTSACNNEIYQYHHLKRAFLPHNLVIRAVDPFLVHVDNSQYRLKLYVNQLILVMFFEYIIL